MSDIKLPDLYFDDSVRLLPPSINFVQLKRDAIPVVLDSLNTKNVFLRAPAGYGKTTMMVQCYSRLRDAGKQVAWLSCDASDNDLTRFVERLQQALEFPQVSAEKLIYLFIDEFEVITESSVQDYFNRFLQHSLLQFRVCVGTRPTSSFNTSRFKAAGTLSELTYADLKFSKQEVGDFLEKVGLSELPGEDVAAFYAKTQGWAAGLSLGVIALKQHSNKSRFISDFSGEQEDITAYLANEVLDSETVVIRRFLLKTSILKELYPELCNQLLSITDSESILQDLALRGMVQTHGRDRGLHYKFHPLFSDFLQKQLIVEGEESHILHRTAAEWFECNGFPELAIDHYLDGRNNVRAIELLQQQAADFYAKGYCWRLYSWLLRIPPHETQQFIDLQVMRIWLTATIKGHREAVALVKMLALEKSHISGITSLLTVVDIYRYLHIDNPKQALVVASPDLEGKSDSEAYIAHGFLTFRAIASLWNGDSASARHYILQDTKSEIFAPDFLRSSIFQALQGWMAFCEGNLQDAESYFKSAETTRFKAQNAFLGGDSFGVLYATLLYERNQLSEAEEIVNSVLKSNPNTLFPDSLIESYCLLAKIRYEQKDVNGAMTALIDLERVGVERSIPRVIVSSHLERSRLHLMQKQKARANQYYLKAKEYELSGHITSNGFFANDLVWGELTEIYLELAFGDPEAVKKLIEKQLVQVKSEGRMRRELLIRLLNVIAESRLNPDLIPMSDFVDILKSFIASGLFRCVVDLGVMVAPLLREVKASRRFQQDQPLQCYVDNLLSSLHETIEDVSDSLFSSTVLTATETKVLNLVAEGESNKSISRTLDISDSTVRTHLRNINKKLHTRSRTHAVIQARQLGLL
ncbi:hypothetical protein R50073_37410 [Maricurvus nonylphenolicus]|uniref:LuxR C-terminal-related transcriptional regulator n=1 Tax=Maricurvus nonylphenolicus TaxID=1008307 RepID=UPI0036F34562